MTVVRLMVACMLAWLMLLATGCATRTPTPSGGGAPVGSSADDGPEARPPPDLLSVPDALPRLEPIRDGGPNKRYDVFGLSYTPLAADADYIEVGQASWYGRKFHGRATASGELYNMYAMTAAHKTLPIPSYVRVSNPANGRSVIVRVNDRGPFIKGRVIDLSYTAALKLDTLHGVASVRVERITPQAMRSGAWQPTTQTTPQPPRTIDSDDPPSDVAPPAPPPPVAGNLAEPAARTPTDAAAPSQRAPTVAARGFWVQLGAFRERGGAMQLQQQAVEHIDSLALMLAVFSEGSLHRVQAGPFDSREEAARVAGRVRELMPISPVVVERR